MDEWERYYLLHSDGGHRAVKREPEEGTCLDIVVILFCAGVCGLALASMVMSAGILAPLGRLFSP